MTAWLILAPAPILRMLIDHAPKSCGKDHKSADLPPQGEGRGEPWRPAKRKTWWHVIRSRAQPPRAFALGRASALLHHKPRRSEARGGKAMDQETLERKSAAAGRGGLTVDREMMAFETDGGIGTKAALG